jgi:pyruvate dehydrogenase E2 component (dihydrolipoamide acetyltransferase)
VKRDVLSQLAPGDSDSVSGTSVPLSPMRRAIAVRLQQSVREAPHFYVAIDVDMSRALELRESLEATVSVNDIIAKACGGALRDFPRMNCRLEGDTAHYLRDVNLGIAVSVDDGLIVPVLERVDTLSLAEVAERSRLLIENARTGRLRVGPRAAFTVSNLGMYGVRWFSAIVNPPEAAILAVGAIEDRVVLTPSGIAARPTLTLTLSSDHRIVDGALAARFLGAVKSRLEEGSDAARPSPGDDRGATPETG